MERRHRERRVARWEDLISVFVDNLSESISVEKLRNVFSSFGRLADSFIPASGRRGKGKCFGFVRYWESKATSHALDSMNGSFIGRRRIVVNIAKYGWANQAKERKTVVRNQSRGEKIPLEIRGADFAERKLGGRGIPRDGDMRSFNRSFAEVVREPCKTKEDCIYVKKESFPKNARWLSNSLVRVVRWEGIIPSISGLWH